jgi:pyruvate dehydrogenase E1 component
VIFDGFSSQLPDIDPTETAEWVDSLEMVTDERGRTRARFLLMKLLERARELGVGLPNTVSSPYINTIPSEREPWFPGDEHIERRIRAFVRWNAAVMVSRANKRAKGIGGHLATYASSAALYEVGFNHFFRGKDDGQPGDQVFFQGHAAPGIYARAYLEGRLSESQLDRFRQEIGGGGLSSYPHPRLMPDFWEFPTVSMGIGPINAVYQARFNRYLLNREMADTSKSRVWCFVGDGEFDEPESMAGLTLASREQLDNLIFVVNCNLQRLDGPVRGNGKVIQEMEALFRGAGWNVIKVIWGSGWDPLLARDVDGVLLNKMNTTLDGEFQKYATESGAYIREHFFGPDPRLRAMVDHLSDDDLRNLPRGGHDYRKLYAAYSAAIERNGAPTVILAKTIKGWTLGPGFEAVNATHQIKEMSKQHLATFRERLHLEKEIPEEALDAPEPPYYRPAEGSVEYEYMMERRRALAGSLPKRVVRQRTLPAPDKKVFAGLQGGSGKREYSTTMAMTGLLRDLLRDKGIGAHVVPIIPDEARTFGMDALFPEVKIYAPFGQLYEPVDAAFPLSYQESQKGQILEEGITEAGSMASFTAAGTSAVTHGKPMVPFWVFYSMFGFQRVGDLIWAFGDMRGKGFLCGATAGRTTLNGEGLQHEDGHSLLLASTVPNLAAYDPAFAYELGVIIEDGIRRMYGPDPEDVFYYLTLYNENYVMPPMPEGAEDGILKGLYRFAPAPDGPSRKATIVFSGTAQKAAREAQEVLAADHDVAAELWSATSFRALREDALSAERWSRLHPTEPPRTPYVTEALSSASGPVRPSPTS